MQNGSFSSLTGKVLIIAEVGSNHDGDLASALAHIDAAADAGADIVKFQSFLADEMIAPSDKNYQLLKTLEMPRDWYPKLMKRCEDRKIRFLSTATNFETIGWMEDLGAWAYKVASCNVTYTPLIDRLVAIGKPVIFSLGLAKLDEIEGLVTSLRNREFHEFAVLHCVARYPAPPESLNLGNIPFFARRLNCPIGFSDHSLGIEAAIAAVALGARIVEKHFSLTGGGLSPDHLVALTPPDFTAMCKAIRSVEQSLETDVVPNPRDICARRRSLHFARPMKAGEIVAERDIKVIRPENGLLPQEMPNVVGARMTKDVNSNEPVAWDALDRAVIRT